jgi:hypothetical protein
MPCAQRIIKLSIASLSSNTKAELDVYIYLRREKEVGGEKGVSRKRNRLDRGEGEVVILAENSGYRSGGVGGGCGRVVKAMRKNKYKLL